jgi:8-oxo-dGTP pyrophosphatase MutT (NUDIX family)
MDRRAHLSGLLLFHRAADALERAHVARLRALLDGPGDPFDRGRTDPGHVTASAFVLSPEHDALLLVWHGKLHRWLQPGGHVEPDDPDVVYAARREVAEEVGCRDVEADGRILDVDVHDIPARPDEAAHAHFDVRFLLVARRRDIEVSAEVREARWVPLAEVASMDTDESVLRAVRRLG